MDYQRMIIEQEAPEEVGAVIRYNLSESAISDQTLNSLGVTIPFDLPLGYTPHKGSEKIREFVAKAAGNHITPEDVIVTAGASISLFIVATSLLRSTDHLIITRPNYASSLETPRAIGCDITYIDLQMESDWQLDLNEVAMAIRPGITKLISVCSPNNPTGTVLDAAVLHGLAELARNSKCHLLVDETYASLTYDEHAGRIPSAASLGPQVVVVSSMSKVYGVPGIRIGWLCTTDPELQLRFLAAKEQMCISGSVLDELIAEQILARSDVLLRETRQDMQQRLAYVEAWVERLNGSVEWVRPQAGVMGFMRVKNRSSCGDADGRGNRAVRDFCAQLLDEHGVYVGPGHWFEREDGIYFRLGFGWPTWCHLKAGLEGIAEVVGSKQV